MLAIYKRELASYFRSPIGWTAIALFAILGGFSFSLSMASNAVNIGGELDFLRMFFFIVIPIITMRLFSEEKRNGTEVLLFTSPVPLHKIILGKYLSALTLLLIMLSTTIVHVIVVLILGGVINASTLGAYVGFIFIGAVFIALGVMASAVTENQIIAAVISFGIILSMQLLQIIAGFLQGVVVSVMNVLNFFNMSDESINRAGENVAAAFKWLDPFARTDSFSIGIFRLSPLVFCASLVVLFLFLTFRILEKKRWSQG
jgi:ABC-2 type transport system permease protein